MRGQDARAVRVRSLRRKSGLELPEFFHGGTGRLIRADPASRDIAAPLWREGDLPGQSDGGTGNRLFLTECRTAGWPAVSFDLVAARTSGRIPSQRNPATMRGRCWLFT